MKIGRKPIHGLIEWETNFMKVTSGAIYDEWWCWLSKGTFPKLSANHHKKMERGLTGPAENS
jgi:hypothetical protein